MKHYTAEPVRSSEITPEHIYLNRRKFMQAAGAAGLSALLAACAPQSLSAVTPAPENSVSNTGGSAEKLVDERGGQANTYEQITNYNNFYEFSMDKEAVAVLARDYKTAPWEVKVGGLVNNPKTYAMEDILKKFPSEERIYRLRCVEGWSMVIPWEGFPLAKLLKEVEPAGDAKYVAFTTVMDPENMPGQQAGYLYPWPYTEGLRLDEALNDLTLMVTGLYGKPVPTQNGAPLRLAVPWKYGFKSIKSIVQIDLVAEEPKTMWSTIAPNEYGFYANVNPDVSHPRWSQSTERRIGELDRRPTLLFNGYGAEVASLYQGMDLKAYY
ncbi:MAG: protein-methionine-sulfoxide reductase catalytic subunit MsrP [Chloroflexi bacterium]|nr:MAG: protein-methionine-sulfoxide reductase catalytic subunit MsrP [Chloroflexota bacterium]